VSLDTRATTVADLDDSRAQRDLQDAQILASAGTAETMSARIAGAGLAEIALWQIPQRAVANLSRWQRRLEKYLDGFLEVQDMLRGCQNLVAHAKDIALIDQGDFWPRVEHLLDEIPSASSLPELVRVENMDLLTRYAERLDAATKQPARALKKDIGERGTIADTMIREAKAMESIVKDMRGRLEREAVDSLRELSGCVTTILAFEPRSFGGEYAGTSRIETGKTARESDDYAVEREKIEQPSAPVAYADDRERSKHGPK